MNRPYTWLLAITFSSPLLARDPNEPFIVEDDTPTRGTSLATKDAPASQPAPALPALEAAAARKLIEELATAMPARRETILRQLATAGSAAAPEAVELLAHPGLGSQLAALELMEAWGAPIDGVDPWDPRTITPERLTALRTWAKSAPIAIATTRPAVPEVTVRSELLRLAECSADAEAAIILERLVRLGPGISTQVRDLLRERNDDLAQQRLTTLRYRLVASEPLVSAWSDGIGQLASRDSQVRRKAVQDLAKRAAAADVPLLRELFSDPDPLVREIALGAIQGISGAAARNALAEMLHDPDPNVRAAVLKHIAEKPDQELTARVIEYARTEIDDDLVLHAARALRATGGDASAKGLMELLKHPSWQVRAEACDALKESASGLGQARAADIYTAMIERLDDPDGFVVARALQCLQQADLAIAMEPMLKAAEKRPELAPEVIKTITSGSNMQRLAPRHLRKFASSANAEVRAAAIQALTQVDPSPEKELTQALGDSELTVRVAAAKALYGMIEEQRPFAKEDRLVRSRTSYGGTGLDPKPQAWVRKFQSGQNRPEWMKPAAELCRASLEQGTPEQRFYLAMPLLAVAGDANAGKAVIQAVEGNPHLAGPAGHALFWVSREARQEMTPRLLALADDGAQQATIVKIATVFADAEGLDKVWAVLNDPKANAEVAEAVYAGLRTFYFGERHYDPAALQMLDRKTIAAELRPRVQNGPELQRTVALGLMLLASPAEAATLAAAIRSDPASSEWSRLDALQVQLLALPPEKALREAKVVMAGQDAALQKVALPFLAERRYELLMLRGVINIADTPFRTASQTDPEGRPLPPSYPEGLDPKLLRPILEYGEERSRNLAAYLLALNGDRQALELLASTWRGRHDREVQRLLYRAIAGNNDDTLTPILEEIYKSYATEDYEIRDFYWTIRSIQGPAVLKLRKKIRDAVGMDRLR